MLPELREEALWRADALLRLREGEDARVAMGPTVDPESRRASVPTPVNCGQVQTIVEPVEAFLAAQ